MPLMFNTILREAGLCLEDVRLLRHQDPRSAKGRTPYELWRDNRQQFEMYQSIQGRDHHSRLVARYWASFVVTLSDETLFAELYGTKYRGLLEQDTPQPQSEGVDRAGSCDVWDLTLDQTLSDLIGRIVIDWGRGTRSWIQRADRQNKPIVELRKEFKEPEFPGFMRFMEPLSKVERLPQSWIAALQSSKGIYLLTCPRTHEQYVGSATGEGDFWGRWLEYLQAGHGGDVALKSREPSDYQVSVLEVAGTAATTDDILKMEARWKQKLQSREMGLNRN